MRDIIIHLLTRGLYDSMNEDIARGEPRLWTLFRYNLLRRKNRV